jgi:NitT/TauT family transport system substrate-binding protein
MLRILAALLLTLFLAEADAATPPPRTRIVFVTDWKAQAEHGGFYEAVAKGYYAKRGLDVVIRAGGPQVNVPQLIAGGAADMGIGSNSFVVLNLVKENVPIRAVMAVFQKDPQVLISHPRRDMTSLAEMKGRPIMVSDAAMTSFWPWLRAKFGFSDRQIRKYTFNLAPFLVDPNAIQEGYLTSEPFTIEQQAHFTPKVFLLADYGYPGYANMVLTSQKLIDANPKAVQAFYDGSRDGWHDYLFADPGPANKLIKRDNPEMTDAIIAQAIDKMKRYQLVTGGDAFAFGIGGMTELRWRQFYQTMQSEGLYPKGLDYTKAYELRFMRGTLQNFK